MPARDIALVLIVVLAWGSNFTAMKIGLEELPPFFFVGLRFAILIPLMLWLPRPAPWRAIIAVGLFINIGQFAFLFSAMAADVTAGLASLILQSQAPITIALAALFFGERIGRMQAAGITLAVIGLALFGVAGGGNATPLGLLLVLIGALSWAIGNLVLRKLPGVNMTALFVWASLIPPLPMLALSLATEDTAPLALILSLSWQTWAALAYVALISTVLGFSIWGTLLSRHRAADVTPFALLIPVVGVTVGALALGERVSFGEAIAGIVVLFGLALAVLGPKLTAAWRRRASSRQA